MNTDVITSTGSEAPPSDDAAGAPVPPSVLEVMQDPPPCVTTTPDLPPAQQNFLSRMQEPLKQEEEEEEEGGTRPTQNKQRLKQTQMLQSAQKAETILNKQMKRFQKQLVGENFERMNYLHQCATLLATAPAASSVISPLSTSICVRDLEHEKYHVSTTAKNYNVFKRACGKKTTVLLCNEPNNVATDAAGRSSFTYQNDNLSPTRDKINDTQQQLRLSSTSGTDKNISEGEHTSLVASHRSLAAQLGTTCRAVGRKCQLRLSHHLKRCLCPGCATPLVPGVTASSRLVRVRGRGELRLRCLTCGAVRKRPCEGKEALWADQPQAQLRAS